MNGKLLNAILGIITAALIGLVIEMHGRLSRLEEKQEQLKENHEIIRSFILSHLEIFAPQGE